MQADTRRTKIARSIAGSDWPPLFRLPGSPPQFRRDAILLHPMHISPRAFRHAYHKDGP